MGKPIGRPKQFQVPQLFWDPLLEATALGHLGKGWEAGTAPAELRRWQQDFLVMGPVPVSCQEKFNPLAPALLDPWRKAGLHI